MAEAARQPEEEVQGNADSQPPGRSRLRGLEGGGQTTPRTKDHLKEVGSDKDERENLANSEQQADSFYSGGQTSNSDPGSFYKKGADSDKKPLRGSLTRRRSIIGGGILGTIVGLMMFFTISGPLQLVHLSQILQHPFSKHNEDSANRLGKLYRTARSNDIGETRVGLLGSKIFGSTIKQLDDIGVKVDRGPTGAPTKMTIDTDKLKANYPELEGMSRNEKISFLTDKLGIPADQIAGSGSRFSIDQRNFGLKTSRLLAKSTVGLLDDGKIVTGIKSRVLTKFFNLPSLFHPIKRALADKENKIANAAERKRAQQQDEKARQASLTEPIEAEGADAIKNVKDKSNKYQSPAMKALAFTGGACFVRSVSGDIITINRDLVVLPSAIRATDIIAAGAQVQAGKDLSVSQPGEIVTGLTDEKGNTIWQAQAMQALVNGGKADQSLADLSPDYQQAFSGDTTAGKIKGWANGALGGDLSASVICSPIGIGVQLAAGLGLTVSSLVAEVGSGGTLTPVVVGVWTAKLGAEFAISAVAMHFVQGLIINGNTAKLAEDAFSGPVGGDLLAYGSRVAANTVSIASGGIALGNQTSTLLAANEYQKDQQQFKSLPITKRLFDPYDSRSAISKFIDGTSTSPSQNLAKMGGIFTNFGSMFSHAFSSLLPHAQAANAYDWKFPQYGIPEDMLKDPALADPYANADIVAGLLDGTDYGFYKSRAHDCFGVELTKITDEDKQRWDVIPSNDVNPNEDSYSNADCSSSDENWRRVVMFIFDTSTMKAAACYEDDAQSCADLGYGGSSTAETNTPVPSGTLPTGTAKDLAGQLEQYLNSGKVQCASSSGFNLGCSDITNTAKGTSIKGGAGCSVDALQPALLGMLLQLLQMGHTFTLSALCSDHHNDGLGGHAGGRAADFNTIDGVFMGPSDTPWDSAKTAAGQKLDQDIASFMPKSTGFGQIQCHPAFAFLSDFNTFPDGCHHQHVQVAG